MFCFVLVESSVESSAGEKDSIMMFINCGGSIVLKLSVKMNLGGNMNESTDVRKQIPWEQFKTEMATNPLIAFLCIQV